MMMWSPLSEAEHAKCFGKRKYGIKDARHAAKWARRTTDEVLVEYRCPYCNRYHVGTRSPGEKSAHVA